MNGRTTGEIELSVTCFIHRKVLPVLEIVQAGSLCGFRWADSSVDETHGTFHFPGLVQAQLRRLLLLLLFSDSIRFILEAAVLGG